MSMAFPVIGSIGTAVGFAENVGEPNGEESGSRDRGVNVEATLRKKSSMYDKHAGSYWE